MDGDPHQRRLHDASSFQCPVQRIPIEVTQSRPEPHVRRGRVLGLEPAEALEGPGDRKGGSFKQQLAREQRSVQLSCGKDAMLSLRESHARQYVPAIGTVNTTRQRGGKAGGALEDRTRQQLYEVAKKRGVPGRSRIGKWDPDRGDTTRAEHAPFCLLSLVELR